MFNVANRKEQTEQKESSTTKNLRTVTPVVDIFEDENEYRIIADFSGISADDLDVAVEKNILTIEGKFTGSARENSEVIYREFSESSYKRSFQLHDHIAADKIEATIANGQLSIKLPKTVPVKTKIQVKKAEG